MLLSKLLHSSVSLQGFSLIDIEPIQNWEFPKCDWIFFTSKNAVQYFFKQQAILGNQKIACVGDGTFKVLSKFVKKVDYIGNAVDTILIGKDFAKILGESTCFFPISNISKQTIQKQLPSQQVIEQVVYTTKASMDKPIPTTEVVVLTSPSNAMNYHSCKGFLANQILIAMGLSTAQQLTQFNIKNTIVIPSKPGEIGIVDCLNNLDG